MVSWIPVSGYLNDKGRKHWNNRKKSAGMTEEGATYMTPLLLHHAPYMLRTSNFLIAAVEAILYVFLC
ncbi:MAG: hypothetical protein LBJ80_04465 [Rickettsiales bacterium]|nr:hypothetical protein [Rickettsiales bacterium]